MRRRSIAIALAALILVGGAWADDLRFGFEGARFFNGVIPGGLDLSLTYYGLSLSDEADTKLFLKGGGGYENASLLRDPLTGDPWLSTVKGNEYYMANFQWELAFIQGFSRRADGVNLLAAFREAGETARADHIPALVHVVECTQPLGHSTSGSHERYKNAERLRWERDFDCLPRFRAGLLSTGAAAAEQLGGRRGGLPPEAAERERAALRIGPVFAPRRFGPAPG